MEILTRQGESPISDVPDRLIGEVVRAWREWRGLTLTALADLAGPPVSKSYLSSLENGRIQSPGRIHLIRIAAGLDLPVSVLMTRRLPSTRDDVDSEIAGTDWDDERLGFVMLRRELRDRFQQAQEHLDEAQRILASLGADVASIDYDEVTQDTVDQGGTSSTDEQDEGSITHPVKSRALTAW